MSDHDTNCSLYVISHEDIPIVETESGIIFDVNPDEFKQMYVGITNDVKVRWQRHFNNSSDYSYPYSKKFYNRIRKYGWNAYNKTVVKTNLSREEAKLLEIETIAHYRSFELGLNSTPGGDGTGSGIDHPLSQAVNVYNNSTGDITSFVCQRDAAKYLGIDYRCVFSTANHYIEYKYQTYSPIFNAYFQVRKADDDIPFIENMPKPKNIIKEIFIIDIDTREELHFVSLAEAGEYLGIDKRNIHNILSNKVSQFYVDNKRYDAQYAPKTREWNLETLPNKSKSYRVIVVNLVTKEESIFDNAKKAIEYFGITKTSLAKVLSEKCPNQQFYVGTDRYGAQYLPKTHEWNFDILPGVEASAATRKVKIVVKNIDTKDKMEFNSMGDAACYFGISQSRITRVISDKYSEKYLNVEGQKYDVQKFSKT